MALIHQATLTPGKLDLLRAWLPTRPWFPAGAEVTALGAYRFDDPAGEVGVETFLLQAGAVVLQVPLTYRSGPLVGAEDALVGTTDHSVLGRRWVHDATADPVWLAALVSTVLTGGTEAAEELEVDGRRQPRDPGATVRGSGAPGAPVPAPGAARVHDDGPTTVVEAGEVEVVLARVVGTPLGDGPTLTGGVSGHDPSVLAVVRTG